MLANSQLIGGLSLFFFQFMIQMGIFFVVPLYLSIVLALSAVQTGARILPLSIALLVSAIGIPRFLPKLSARLVLRTGFGLMTVGIILLVVRVDPASGAEIVLIPMVLIGLASAHWHHSSGRSPCQRWPIRTVPRLADCRTP